MDWIKNPNTQNSDKKTIIILYIGDENIICANTLSLIPISFTELEHKKISDTIKYDEINKNIIEYYKTIFSDLFKKNDKDINIFNNIYTLSWNDKINANQVNKFINCLM
jgi:predicted metal-dependent hydrolase